jgi:hypothetical protein
VFRLAGETKITQGGSATASSHDHHDQRIEQRQQQQQQPTAGEREKETIQILIFYYKEVKRERERERESHAWPTHLFLFSCWRNDETKWLLSFFFPFLFKEKYHFLAPGWVRHDRYTQQPFPTPFS